LTLGLGVAFRRSPVLLGAFTIASAAQALMLGPPCVTGCLVRSRRPVMLGRRTIVRTRGPLVSTPTPITRAMHTGLGLARMPLDVEITRRILPITATQLDQACPDLLDALPRGFETHLGLGPRSLCVLPHRLVLSPRHLRASVSQAQAPRQCRGAGHATGRA
jgi:hypothetical protein